MRSRLRPAPNYHQPDDHVVWNRYGDDRRHDIYTLSGGVDGNWYTDLEATPRLNRAVRDWSQSYFQALNGYGFDATASFSMELGNGDPSTGAGIAQRYPDQTAGAAQHSLAANELLAHQRDFLATGIPGHGDRADTPRA